LLVRPGYGPATAKAFAETSEALPATARSAVTSRQDDRSLDGVEKKGGKLKS